jgi:hypothetical protein
MANAKFYKMTSVNVLKIYRFLREAQNNGTDFSTVGEIARGTGLHKWTVSRTLDIWMSPIVEMMIPEELEDVGLKLKLVKLTNPNLSEEQVLRFLKIRLY